ncbi:zinc-binding domain-containing protein [Pyrenochaeta sp. MPI-SDFR-AT-0127]|nr:zinc-binding domain-containing protein [Pyrenochaeta sp. MPI-SDFR-AT-0127]
MSGKRKESTPKSPKCWSMYPSYHKAVSDLLGEHDLFFDFHRDDDSDCEEEYDTNIMGFFICHNRGCTTRGWSSKLVAITIRMYPGAEYNARVYHQHCDSCNKLSKPKLDRSYAERVAYRLKKWSGVQMERPQYSGQSKAPHRSDLCEGCKHGHCKG